MNRLFNRHRNIESPKTFHKSTACLFPAQSPPMASMTALLQVARSFEIPTRRETDGTRTTPHMPPCLHSPRAAAAGAWQPGPPERLLRRKWGILPLQWDFISLASSCPAGTPAESRLHPEQQGTEKDGVALRPGRDQGRVTSLSLCCAQTVS